MNRIVFAEISKDGSLIKIKVTELYNYFIARYNSYYFNNLSNKVQTTITNNKKFKTLDGLIC